MLKKEEKTEEDNELNTYKRCKIILPSIINEIKVVKNLIKLEKEKDEEAISLLWVLRLHIKKETVY